MPVSDRFIRRVSTDYYWLFTLKGVYDSGSGSLMKAAEMAGREDFLQSGIGLIDALIIQAILDGDHLPWTLDKRIAGRLQQKNLYSWKQQGAS
mgnify:FL=1